MTVFIPANVQGFKSFTSNEGPVIKVLLTHANAVFAAFIETKVRDYMDREVCMPVTTGAGITEWGGQWRVGLYFKNSFIATEV